MSMIINPENLDALMELMNIGIGKAASLLNEITSSHIRLSVPQVSIINLEDIKSLNLFAENETCAQVKLDFWGAFSGTSLLVFPAESAAALVMTITGEESGAPELDSIRAETLKEVGNIFINGVMGSISNILKQQISYSLPTYHEERLESLKDIIETEKSKYVILTTTNFYVENINVRGIIFLILEMESLNLLLKRIETVDSVGISGT